MLKDRLAHRQLGRLLTMRALAGHVLADVIIDADLDTQSLQSCNAAVVSEDAAYLKAHQDVGTTSAGVLHGIAQRLV